MKNKIPVLLMVLVLIFSLAACGNEYVGTYKCTNVSMEVEGETTSLDAAEVFDEDIVITLKDDGNAKVNLAGEEVEGTWKTNGKEFTLTVEKNESKGTIKEDTITVDFFGTGLNCTFKKDKK